MEMYSNKSSTGGYDNVVIVFNTVRHVEMIEGEVLKGREGGETIINAGSPWPIYPVMQ